ncbi:MAG TPA: glycosyltransferase family 39 protein, partial [Vicinamibacteria bacterium]
MKTPTPTPTRRAVGYLLVALALGLMACRFARLELASFARDEPQFLSAARQQLRTGRWLGANPLYGNMGLRYGPAAFWFYGVVLGIFGDQPRTAILAMGLVVTLAQLGFVFAAVRLLGDGEDAAFRGALLAWVASSPYQFHWSRLAWDLTSNAAAFAAAALLCWRGELRAGRAVALGLALGLGLATHPSLTPLVAAVGLTFAWERRTASRGARRSWWIVLAVLAAVNLPYLVFLLRAPVVARAARQPFALAELAELPLEAPRLATPWGLGYFFDGSWPDFLARWGSGAGAVQALSHAALGGCTAVAVAGLALAWRSSDPGRRRLARVGVFAWAGTVVLLAAVGLERHPHYQFACAWVPLFGVAAFVSWLRERSPRAGAAALAVLLAVAVAQAALIVEWMRFVRDQSGTRGPTYGTPLGREVAAMRLICSAPEPRFVLRNETA